MQLDVRLHVPSKEKQTAVQVVTFGIWFVSLKAQSTRSELMSFCVAHGNTAYSFCRFLNQNSTRAFVGRSDGRFFRLLFKAG